MDVPVVQSLQEHMESREDLSAGAHLGAYSDRQCASAADRRTGPFHKEIDEVILPAERSSECIGEQIIDVPVPQIQEHIVEVASTIPQERTSEHTVEQIAGVPVPRVQERILDVAEIIPRSAFGSVLSDRLKMCQCLRS